MLSHDNVTYSARVCMLTYEWKQETLLSYLPLSHVAALLIDGHCNICVGGATYCADKNALKGTLVN
jgi:long-chain-fatty-acid--CoA ligase ACSBG